MLRCLSLFILNHSAQQSCLPTDSCGIAPKLCMNGFITTMPGYTAGSEQIICPNGQQWGVHNVLDCIRPNSIFFRNHS
ncbi:MAG: hypothetical protein IPL95_12825 [Saprospiraceae bacterium]|nr:hypothetical protein [Saprospiraceae bacterium]